MMMSAIPEMAACTSRKGHFLNEGGALGRTQKHLAAFVELWTAVFSGRAAVRFCLKAFPIIQPIKIRVVSTGPPAAFLIPAAFAGTAAVLGSWWSWTTWTWRRNSMRLVAYILYASKGTGQTQHSKFYLQVPYHQEVEAVVQPHTRPATLAGLRAASSAPQFEQCLGPSILGSPAKWYFMVPRKVESTFLRGTAPGRGAT